VAQLHQIRSAFFQHSATEPEVVAGRFHQSDQFLWKENGVVKLGLIMDTKEVNRRCKTKVLAKNPLQNLIENHLYSHQHT